MVPITTNDAWPGGHFTSVDIYGTSFSWKLASGLMIDLIIGYDSYPNGFDCTHPHDWLPAAVPEYARCLSPASNV